MIEGWGGYWDDVLYISLFGPDPYLTESRKSGYLYLSIKKWTKKILVLVHERPNQPGYTYRFAFVLTILMVSLVY